MGKPVPEELEGLWRITCQQAANLHGQLVFKQVSPKQDSHVATVTGQPLFWVYCPSCRLVDLYDLHWAEQSRRTSCQFCLRSNVGTVPAERQVRPLPFQLECTAAFLLGGLEAVRAIACEL